MTTASEPATAAGAIFRLLGRVTTSGRFLPEVDGLRFVAIVAVLLAHIASELDAKTRPEAWGPVGTPLLAAYHCGAMGVHLFFGISGFILALPFAEAALAGGRTVGLLPYYRRRVCRIEPPYIINMTLVYGLMLLAHGAARYHLFPNYLASLAYVHNFLYHEWSAINFVAWSLEVEVQFYLLAPLLALVFRVDNRFTRRTLIVGLMLLPVLAGRLVPASSSPWMGRTVLLLGQYFLAGFLMADIYLVDWSERPVCSGGWDLTALASFPFFFASARREELRVIAPLLLLLGFAGAFRGRAVSAALSNRWVATIGGMCYTIYLIPLLDRPPGRSPPGSPDAGPVADGPAPRTSAPRHPHYPRALRDAVRPVREAVHVPRRACPLRHRPASAVRPRVIADFLSAGVERPDYPRASAAKTV